MRRRLSITILNAIIHFSQNKETGNFFPTSTKSPHSIEYITALMHLNFPQGLKTNEHVSSLVHLFKIKIEDIRNGFDIPMKYKYTVRGRLGIPSKILEIYLEKASTEDLLAEIFP
jgi:hypothetical protein